jgi:hypothetical protein
MKLNMLVTPVLDGSVSSLTGVMTDMLVLGKFEDGGDGSVPLFDELTHGQLSRLLQARAFTGRLGQRFTYQNRGKQGHLLVVGLGQGSQFDGKTIARFVGISVHKAVKHHCSKLSFQFQSVSHFTEGLKLSSQAQFLHEAAAVKLGEYDGDDALTVELLCAKSGKARHELVRGVEMPLTGRICWQHVDGHKCLN